MSLKRPDLSDGGDKSLLLPSSVSYSFAKSQSITDNDFLRSTPVVHRFRLDLFGVDSDASLPLNALRTPREIREQMVASKAHSAALQNQRVSRRNKLRRSGERLVPLDRQNKAATAAPKQSTVINKPQRSHKKEQSPSSSSPAIATAPVVVPEGGALPASRRMDSAYLLTDAEKLAKRLQIAQRKKDRGEKIGKAMRGIGADDAITAEASRDILELATAAVNRPVSHHDVSNESAETAHDDLRGIYHQYFGPSAKASLNATFQRAKEALAKYPDDESISSPMNTPRQMYLREVEKAQLLPLPLVLRKETNPKGVFLGSKGLGDKRMLPIINIIDKLPAVETLDLSDNRLTDVSLMPLSVKLCGMENLTHMDLSFNKIDDSSETIMDYLRSEDCRLRVLVLNGADVDDGESVNLFQAIASNRSVQSLSLSRNLIGNAELDSIVDPDLVTGGVAIGDMLRQNSILTELDLSWNSIRLKSAEAVGKALADNTTLKVLKLGYNTFGDLGTQMIGMALKQNHALKYLDIACNSIVPKSAVVLANGLFSNHSLEYCNVDGNILGTVGTQALVSAIQISAFGEDSGRQLRVSFNNCDCKKFVEGLFNASNPTGVWVVDLEEPYGQMVVEECIFLANHRAGCNLISLMHNGREVGLTRALPPGARDFNIDEFYKNSRGCSEDLVAGDCPAASGWLKKLLLQFGFSMGDLQRLDVVKHAESAWRAKSNKKGEREDLSEVLLFEVFHALFVINDTDVSGTMDVHELQETLASLGKPELDKGYLGRLMSEHDKDDSGTIDANEFAMIMVNEFCRTDLPKGHLVDKGTNKPYEIPKTGTATINMYYECDAPSSGDVGEDEGIDSVIRAIRDAKTTEQKEIIFDQATSSPYFYMSAEQGQILFDEVQGLSKSAMDIIACILPQLVNDEHVNRFIDSNLTPLGKLALRVRLGQLYNCYVGITTGHYNVDLRHHEQVQGVKRLSALSVAESKFNKTINLDTSQRGNRTNYRNELYAGNLLKLSGGWFASCPNSGVLKFDYVSTTRPREGTRPLSSSRYLNMMAKLDFAGMADMIVAVLRDAELQKSRQSSRNRKASQKNGAEIISILHDDNAEVLGDKDEGEGEHEGILYGTVERLGDSDAQQVDIPVQEYSVDESELSVTAAHNNSQPIRDRARSLSVNSGHRQRLSSNGSRPSTGNSDDLELQPGVKHQSEVISPPLTMGHVREQFLEYMNTCYHFHDILPKERQRDVSRDTYDPNKVPSTPDDLKSGPTPSREVMPLFYPLVYRKLLEFQTVLPSIYLSVEQLIEILRYFPTDAYLRVQLIQSAFNRITDLDNFEMIYDHVLTEDERRETLHRLGILNVMNPMSPDRQYSLDLRRWDHREMCKILVTLADVEPGENWVGAQYRWGKYDDPVPGWVLPVSWLGSDEDSNGDGGPRRHGWLQLRYRSEGFGCAPVVSTRKQLKKQTLCGMKRLL